MNTEATGTISAESNNLNSGIGLDEAAASNAFLEAVGELPEDNNVEETSDEELPTDSDETEDDVEYEDEPEDEPEDADEHSEGDEAGDDTEEFYVVTIGDEELEVSEDELLSGYQRQRDYTKKTQELATQRKDLETELEQVQAERQRYVKAVEQLLEVESKELEKYSNIEWDKLRAEDPNQFLMLQYEMNEVRQRLSDKKAQREDALKGIDSTTQEQEKEVMRKEQERVRELVTGWEGEGHDTLVESLRTQASKEGFTDEDQALFKHAMVIKLLQKANQYDAQQEKKEKVVQKKVSRKVPKVVKSGNKSDTADTKRAANRQKQMERLKQTGNIQDSVALFVDYV